MDHTPDNLNTESIITTSPRNVNIPKLSLSGLGETNDPREIGPDEKIDLKVKVVVIGDNGVGKTALMKQYVSKNFSNDYVATVGVDIVSKNVQLDNKNICVQIYDTAGQERFNALGASFYRGSSACILVFDTTNQKSFESLLQWKEKFQAHNNETDCYFVVLGNKIDLEKQRVVTQQSAMTWCLGNGIPYFETSALMAINVELCLRSIIKDALKKSLRKEQITAPHVTLESVEKCEQKSAGCC